MPERQDWKLVDAWEQNKRHPRTFSIPPLKDLVALKPGDFVKIGVEWERRVTFRGVPSTAERFWVSIVHIEGEVCQGVVENNLVFATTHGLDVGDAIAFRFQNILSVDVPGPLDFPPNQQPPLS